MQTIMLLLQALHSAGAIALLAKLIALLKVASFVLMLKVTMMSPLMHPTMPDPMVTTELVGEAGEKHPEPP
jgi:hypothetical protein